MTSKVSKKKSLQISVAIVDDDPGICVTVQEGLKSFPDMWCAGCYTDPVAALAELPQMGPDIIFLDIRMPHISGLEWLRRYRRRTTSSQIIVLTALTDEESLDDSIIAGAAGYLAKPFDLEELHTAIKEAMAGGNPVSAKMTHYFIAPLRDRRGERGKESMLSPRQNEIMELRSRGKLYKEVAQLLGISNSTVREQIRRIYKKLGVNTSTEAIRKWKGIDT